MNFFFFFGVKWSFFLGDYDQAFEKATTYLSHKGSGLDVVQKTKNTKKTVRGRNFRGLSKRDLGA